jgi:hypothetical protein
MERIITETTQIKNQTPCYKQQKQTGWVLPQQVTQASYSHPEEQKKGLLKTHTSSSLHFLFWGPRKRILYF